MKPEWVTAIFTGVLTVATILYVVYTRRLWRETKNSADAATKTALAAKQSADAATDAAVIAKQSSDTAIELNRPILGIATVVLVERTGAALKWPERAIIVTLQNYGTLYAKNVLLEWKSYLQGLNETRNSGNQGPIDIAQGASCPITLSVGISTEDAARMTKGGEHYKIRIQADYSGPNEKRRWRYTAVRALRLPSTFTMDDQFPDRTEEVPVK